MTGRAQIVADFGTLLAALEDLWRAQFGGPKGRAQNAKELEEPAGDTVYRFKATSEAVKAVKRLEESSWSLPYPIALREPGDLLAVMVVCVSQDGAAASIQFALSIDYQGDAYGLCVRYESPEALWYLDEDGPECPQDDATGGVHDYAHVQLSDTVRGDHDPLQDLPGPPAWLPDSRLAPPLPAQEPIDLALCGLWAIRGLQFIDEVVRAANDPRMEEARERIVDAVWHLDA